MSRWIYIDDICIPSDENDWEELVAFADAIAEQEPIDIVRCSECKYWKESQYYPDIMVCTYLKGTTFIRQDDDFCSRGEPNKSETPTDSERSSE